MLPGVLHSDRDIDVNFAIMRAFVRLREILATHNDLARKLEQVEDKLGEYDRKLQVVFDAMRRLTAPLKPRKKKRVIGFGRE
jgi:hypothetical protein